MRRKWVWARNEVSTTVPILGAIFVDALGEFEAAYGADLLGATVMRVRGQMVADQTVTAGMRVYTQSTFPVLASPDNGPRTDLNADWFLYLPSYQVDSSSTAIRTVLEIDVSSARKLEELGQGLLWSVENHSSSAANVAWTLSLGLKLP